MTKVRLIFSLVVCVVLVMGVSAQAEDDDGPPPHVVIGIDGNASVERGDRAANALLAGAAPLTTGSVVWSDDLIRVDEFTTVWVLCANLDVDVIDVFSRSPECATDVEPRVITWGGLDVVERSKRSTGDNEFLHIISPRNTDLMYGNPDIRWRGLPNAVSYTVRLEQADGTIIWEEDGITDTVVEWPAGEFMQPDQEFVFSVVAFNSNGEIISTRPYPYFADRNVTVLNFNTRTPLEEELVSLDNIDYPVDTAEGIPSYLRAMFFYRNGLYADALMELATLINVVEPGVQDAVGLPGSPYIYFLLGDVYMQTNLPDLAEIAYQVALDAAIQDEDQSSESVAYLRLAGLTNLPDEKRTYYQNALEILVDIGGAEAVVADIEARIADLD